MKDRKREGGERGDDQRNPEGAGRREEPKQREEREGGWWRNRRGSAAARPTLTRDWGGHQVKDPSIKRPRCDTNEGSETEVTVMMMRE